MEFHEVPNSYEISTNILHYEVCASFVNITRMKFIIINDVQILLRCSTHSCLNTRHIIFNTFYQHALRVTMLAHTGGCPSLCAACDEQICWRCDKAEARSGTSGVRRDYSRFTRDRWDTPLEQMLAACSCTRHEPPSAS
jgi:hypothetical protein